MDRRDFLKRASLVTSGTFLLPSFLRANILTSMPSLTNKRLVVIQLSGGNDGLNTIVPYGLDEYHQNRSNIGYDLNDLHKIDDKFGFNPALKSLSKLHKEGLLSIINSVGYPNPNRSHFRSMDIWHSASDANEYLSTGWLGRFMDSNCQNAHQGIEWDSSLSMALKGQHQSGVALTNSDVFYKTINSNFYNSEFLNTPKNGSVEQDYLYKVFADTKNSAEFIHDQYRLKTNNVDYGKTKLGQKLKSISTLIKSGIETPVFYTSLGGFDTHVNQKVSHEKLMTELDESVDCFVNDLKESKCLQDTTIMIFSEFGRRLKENNSRGTDHGAANAMFIIDGSLSDKAHQLNHIDLTDLEKGDPKYKVDFRSVYQEVLNSTLRVDARQILGKSYKELKLFLR